MKKTVCFIAVIVAVFAFCSCGNNGRLPETLIGTWHTEEKFNEEHNANFLKSFDFFDEEIKLLSGVRFSAEKDFILVKGEKGDAYSFCYNEAGTRDLLKKNFDKVFQTTFDERASLETAYGNNVKTITDLTAWKEYQAKNYGYSSYDEMIEDFVNCAVSEYFGEDFFSKKLEEGDISLSDGKMVTLPKGSDEKEEVAYSLTDGILTLTYSNATERYTK